MAGSRARSHSGFMSYYTTDTTVRCHERGQFPYVEVDLGGVPFVAQEIAWFDQRVMIQYPRLITDQRHYSQLVVCWVDRNHIRRIRREDSPWHNVLDHIDWHEIEDDTLDADPPLSKEKA